jgi:hypothetical protein
MLKLLSTVMPVGIPRPVIVATGATLNGVAVGAGVGDGDAVAPVGVAVGDGVGDGVAVGEGVGEGDGNEYSVTVPPCRFAA